MPTEPDAGIESRAGAGGAPGGRAADRIPATPAAARRRALHGLITARGFASVSALAREIGISEMTIRRDLAALESVGAIERARGGALSRAPRVAEPSFAARRNRQSAAKAAIAAAAVGLVRPGDVLGLDVGSTVAALAALLRGRSDISVITNSLQSVLALSSPDRALPDVYLLGGRLRLQEGSTCGTTTLEQLARRWMTRVFLGVAGLDADGLYDYSPEEVEVKAAFIRHARERILLCDASKFGEHSSVRVAGLDCITTLITDRGPPPAIMEGLQSCSATVLVVGTS